MISKPLLYLSNHFDNDKNLYYDNLTRVRTHNHIFQRIKYFLVGITHTAQQAAITLSKIIGLKTQTEQPLVNIKQLQEVCSLSPKYAGELVNLFEPNENKETIVFV